MLFNNLPLIPCTSLSSKDRNKCSFKRATFPFGNLTFNCLNIWPNSTSDLLASPHSSPFLHYFLIDDISATVISLSSSLLLVLISLRQHHVRQRDLHKLFKKYVLSQRLIRNALCFHSMIASIVHHYYIVSPKFGEVCPELHKKEL